VIGSGFILTTPSGADIDWIADAVSEALPAVGGWKLTVLDPAGGNDTSTRPIVGWRIGRYETTPIVAGENLLPENPMLLVAPDGTALEYPGGCDCWPDEATAIAAVQDQIRRLPRNAVIEPSIVRPLSVGRWKAESDTRADVFSAALTDWKQRRAKDPLRCAGCEHEFAAGDEMPTTFWFTSPPPRVIAVCKQCAARPDKELIEAGTTLVQSATGSQELSEDGVVLE
jgi:hypothetical protein